jgi:hypothetical protein
MRDLLVFGVILAASCLLSALILNAIKWSARPGQGQKNIRSE